MPKSMCSCMTKPKLPLWLKFSFLSSYSFTLNPRSRISSAWEKGQEKDQEKDLEKFQEKDQDEQQFMEREIYGQLAVHL